MKTLNLLKVLVLSSSILLLIALPGCNENLGPVENQQIAQTTGDRVPIMPKTTATTLLQLNPAANTYLGCYDWYSSAGANAAPIWVSHTIDLAPYANKNVKITFAFYTGDPLYNFQEGWYLDDFAIDGMTDDVESGGWEWVPTGYWHMSTARSYSATHSWRYANPATGNYQGATIYSDCWDEANSGMLSISVGLGATPSMSFRTLWVIEGVQPAQFDIMQVQIEVLPTVVANVDIKPGGCPNPLNTNANGTLPVALVGTSTFDVTNVDDATVALNGIYQGPQPPYDYDVATPYGMPLVDCMSCNASGADGILDATYYFDNQLIVGTLGAVSNNDCIFLTMTGQLASNGLYFSGQDVVRIKTK